MAPLPRHKRVPAHGPPPGQRQRQQLRHVVRLKVRRQTANQVEQSLQLLNLLIERLVEFVGLGVSGGVFNAAGRNAQQRPEKLYLFVANTTVERASERQKAGRMREIADWQYEVQPGPPSDLLIELLASGKFGQSARQRNAHG